MQPNLRQVHLFARELLDELAGLGYDVAPGQLGENVTTLGLDLLARVVGRREDASVERSAPSAGAGLTLDRSASADRPETVGRSS